MTPLTPILSQPAFHGYTERPTARSAQPAAPAGTPFSARPSAALLQTYFQGLASPVFGRARLDHEPMKIATTIYNKLEKGEVITKNEAEQLKRSLGAVSDPLADISQPLPPSERIQITPVSFTPAYLQEHSDVIKRTLRGWLYATQYEAGTYKYHNPQSGKIESHQVHNAEIGQRLQASYSSDELKNMKTFLLEKGVYAIEPDTETGLAKTSGAEASESFEMSSQYWLTDIIRTNELYKFLAEADPANNARYADAIRKNLTLLGQFYTEGKEKVPMMQIIHHPGTYGPSVPGCDQVVDAIIGLAHVLQPKKTRDPATQEEVTKLVRRWANNKRLESQGLALNAFVTNIKESLLDPKPWQFGTTANEIPENVIQAVAMIPQFARAINYASAASNGIWEELALKLGLTNDTESVRRSLENLYDLMFNAEYTSPEITALRDRIRHAEKQFLKDLDLDPEHKDYLSQSLLDNPEAVRDLIQQGQERVERTYKEESPSRPVDMGLVFVTQSTVKLDPDPLKDIQKHTEILDMLDAHLVGANGARRYAPWKLNVNGEDVWQPDAYLAQGYHGAVDRDMNLNIAWWEFQNQFGSTDASALQKYLQRSMLLKEGHEAQWWLVTDMSTGYGKQLLKLLDWYETQNPTGKALQQFKRQMKKLYISEINHYNAGLGRITGITAEDPKTKEQAILRSNGNPTRSFQIPEAYEYAPSFKQGSDGKRQWVMLPGQHTPLGWAQASSAVAQTTLENVTGRLESLGLLADIRTAANDYQPDSALKIPAAA